MLEYLNRTLGLSASLSPWTEAEKFPLYLRRGRKYSLLSLDGVECVLVEADEQSFSLPAFLKHVTKLPLQDRPIVLCFEHLDSRHRRSLIDARLPFIVPGSQLYLPFMGAVLRERTKVVIYAPEKISPSAQLILLYLMRSSKGPSSKTALAKQLGISAMGVTRAVRELTALDLVSETREGRCGLVSVDGSRRAVMERALPHMIDPVQTRVFVRREDAFVGLPLAGESALAAYSSLGEPQVECRAVGRREYRTIHGAEEIDPSWCTCQDYSQLELWKYDPMPLIQSSTVDVISLLLSLRGIRDERVEYALEEMLSGYEW